jgi:hypothetical protein
MKKHPAQHQWLSSLDQYTKMASERRKERDNTIEGHVLNEIKSLLSNNNVMIADADDDLMNDDLSLNTLVARSPWNSKIAKICINFRDNMIVVLQTETVEIPHGTFTKISTKMSLCDPNCFHKLESTINHILFE